MDPLVRIELDKLWAFAGEIDYRRVLLACAFIGALGYLAYRMIQLEGRVNYWSGRTLVNVDRLNRMEAGSQPEPETDCAPKA